MRRGLVLLVELDAEDRMRLLFATDDPRVVHTLDNVRRLFARQDGTSDADLARGKPFAPRVRIEDAPRPQRRRWPVH